MSRTLTDEDIEAITLRLVQLMATRLAAKEPPGEAASPPRAPQTPEPQKTPTPKLAYTLKELCGELGVSSVTIYRLTCRGLLKPLPYFRTKIYARAEVERFIAEGMNWNTNRRDPRSK